KTNIYSHDILPEEFHSILFIVSGVLNISMINKTHSFITHDLILIPNSIKFEIEQTDSDLKIYILCFSPLLLIDTHMDYRLKYLFLSNPNFMLISIGNNDILFIKKIFKLIYIAYKENKESLQKDLLTVGFNFLIKRKMNTQSTFANTQKQKQKIILNFFSILQQNFRREHQVIF